MPVPDFSDPRPPYLQIAEDLRQHIQAGRYQPGDRLPSLPVLQKTYGTASETIRHALRELRDKGLVETQSTRGTFVLKQSPDSVGGDVEAHLARHDDEIAKLREELEFMQAQVEALGGTVAAETGTGR